jgi:ribose 5-phosphate isomerase B
MTREKVEMIYLAGDHAGFKLKNKVKKFLDSKKIPWEDLGPLKYNSKDDYPDFVLPAARKVLKNSRSRGIFVAGSGMGEAIAANKFKGIRVALYHGGNVKIVNTSRVHDDSNILSIGSRFVSFVEAKKAINMFLKTKFAGGRHGRRLKKYEKLGSK